LTWPRDIPLPGNFRLEHPFDHGNLRGRDDLGGTLEAWLKQNGDPLFKASLP